jgi:hypothetical protein
MTAAILFHPQITAAEAKSIATGQGGRAVWSRGRIRMAMWHSDQADAAIEAENYPAALSHLRAAHEAVFGGEVAPCMS